MFLIPPTVFTRMGKNAEMKTMKTFDHMPMPNQIMISGIIARRGVAYNAFKNGSATRRIRRYQPMITPRTTPATSASAKPRAKFLPLYLISATRVPSSNK